MKTVILEKEFSAAHFYNQPQWTPQKNQEEFGRCYTEYGHGHNYRLRAEFLETSDLALEDFRKILNSVVSVIDHEHLNFVVPEFQNKIPTTEVILEYISEKLKKKMGPKSLVNLELFETHDIGARLK